MSAAVCHRLSQKTHGVKTFNYNFRNLRQQAAVQRSVTECNMHVVLFFLVQGLKTFTDEGGV